MCKTPLSVTAVLIVTAAADVFFHAPLMPDTEKVCGRKATTPDGVSHILSC